MTVKDTLNAVKNLYDHYEGNVDKLVVNLKLSAQ